MIHAGGVAAPLISFLLFPRFTRQAQGVKPMVEGWEVSINERQPPARVVDAIGVKPVMVIGEVGAGTGRVTIWLAEWVGPQGRIYANDINESALRRLKARCGRTWGGVHVRIAGKPAGVRPSRRTGRGAE